MTRDYYEVLGVPRDADTQTIKKAYRRLARELHPDVNPDDPSCEEGFKEATLAYEVLSDPEKRRTYDMYGPEAFHHDGAGAGGFRGFGDFGDIFESFFGPWFGTGSPRQRGPVRGEDLVVELELDLEEAAFGVTKNVEVRSLDTCSTCAGTGTSDPSSIITCPVCGGSGRVRQVKQTLLGQFIQTSACARCHGEGRIIGAPCPTCGGAGRAVRTRTLAVDIPAGIADGQRVRLTGRGGAGERRGGSGDLYVQVHIRPHPVFERKGDDVICRQDLTMVEAALGADVTVPTLEGEEEIHFPPGTQPGDIVVLKSRGIPHLRQPGRGSQHVVVNVVIPRNLDERQRGLLHEFDECCGEEHYAQKPDGFFQKVKQLFTG